MSRFLGTTIGPMNASFGATAMADASWCAYANRMDFSHNPWIDGMDAQPANFFAGWTRSGMTGTDVIMHAGPNCADDSGAWGVYAEGSSGSGSHKFIIGQAKDEGGSGVSGAEVDCYLTSTDELVSTTGADADGNFMAPTPNSGLTHYLIGRGTGIAGATVNTLIPTNANGT